MAEFLAMQVRMGRITVEQVPMAYHDRVKALLAEET